MNEDQEMYALLIIEAPILLITDVHFGRLLLCCDARTLLKLLNRNVYYVVRLAGVCYFFLYW